VDSSIYRNLFRSDHKPRLMNYQVNRMSTRVRALVLFASGVLAMAATALTAQAQEPIQFVPGRVLVKFKRDVPDSEAHSAFSRFRARAARKIEGIAVHVLELPEGASEEAYVQALRSQDDVEFAELDRLVHVSDVIPNDPMFGDAWHLTRIAAPAAWSITTGSSNLVVAVLDTGVDGTHPDLAAKMVPGWNFYNNNSDTADVYGHGTKTAGTIAAVTNNGTGVSSVCWNCKIMPLRISDPYGWGSYSAMSSALVWAADRGAKVANLSFAIDGSAAITSAASYFASRGGVLAVSAGNAGAVDSASDNPNMLRVSATDPNDALYGWSNTGNNIDLSAPGCVVTTLRGGGYGSGCGTSYSAPVVSGVAALVLSLKPNATPAEVTSILRQSADEAGPSGWDPQYGWGRVNAYRAASLASSGAAPDQQAPTVSFSAPAGGSTVSGAVPVQISATDNTGVVSVTFSVDGVYRAAWTGGPYTYTLDTTALSNGNHTLTA
jgi:subtilisin family serine protease